MTAGQYWEEVQKPVGMYKPANPNEWIVVMDLGTGEDKVSKTGPDSFASKADAEAYANTANRKSGAFTKVHSIDITPAMKKSVMTEGQPISRTNQPQFDWTAGVKSLVRQQA